MGRLDKNCSQTLCYECPFNKKSILCDYAFDHYEVNLQQILDDFKKEIEQVESNGQ